MIMILNQKNYDKTSQFDSISVQSVSYGRYKSDIQCVKNKFYNSQLVYVTAGKMRLKSDGAEDILSKDNYTVIPPFTDFSASVETECCCYSVAFSGGHELISEFEKNVFSVKQSTMFIYDILRKLHGLYGSSGNSDYLDILFLTLFYELDAAEKTVTEKQLTAEKIMKYIDDNLSEPAALENLCREFSYSSDYISRKFKASCGVTVKQYINQKKLTAAKELLETTALSIEKIGKNVGFDDVRLFGKFFKYHEKITPNEYRSKRRDK